MTPATAKAIKRQKNAPEQLQVWLDQFPEGSRVKTSWSEKVFLVEFKK